MNSTSSPYLEVKNNAEKQVVIVAGEASADLHGANLVRAMKRLDPSISMKGIGGQKMAGAGVRIIVPSSDMAVVGLTEVLPRIRTIVGAHYRLKKILKNEHPKLLILLDYPEFNIHLAKFANRYRIPVLYYISPQVWAWRRGRVKKIAKRVDRMAVILPFEEGFYRERGMHVTYVGHPLLDAFHEQQNGRDMFSHRLGLESGRPIIGLLPGSRKEEVGHLLPLMVKAVDIMATRYQKIKCILPVASTISREWVEHMIGSSLAPIRLIEGNIHQALGPCEMALVASGTATLETAISEVPMVIVYRVARFSYWIGKRIVKVPHIGLVNLVAEKTIVPELVQDDVTPERMAEEGLAILGDSKKRENMIKNLKMVKQRLGKGGASERTASIALEMIKDGKNHIGR